MTVRPAIEEDAEFSKSAFVRQLILAQSAQNVGCPADGRGDERIPRKILRYWHDPLNLPDDVGECIASWERLADEGFEFFLHDDVSAAKYIARRFGQREKSAFARCAHPAMRSDYLRLCFMVAEGGFYVDADDVLISEDWPRLFYNNRLKLQPLCYDITAGGMMDAAEIWNPEVASEGRNFYVNNDPLVAPAKHPLLIQALARATDKLLGESAFPDIQATTGPGNLTIVLVAHAKRLQSCGLPLDFEFIKDWDSIAEMRWQLSYRGDERNWRNVYGC